MFRGFLCGKRTEFFHTFAIAIEAEIPERLNGDVDRRQEARGIGAKSAARAWKPVRSKQSTASFGTAIRIRERIAQS